MRKQADISSHSAALSQIVVSHGYSRVEILYFRAVITGTSTENHGYSYESVLLPRKVIMTPAE